MCPNWCSSENTGLKFIKQRLTSKLECMHTCAHMTYAQSCRVSLWLVCVDLSVALSGCTIYWLVSCLLRIVPGSLSAICLLEAHVIRMLNLCMLKYTQIHTCSCCVDPYTDTYSTHRCVLIHIHVLNVADICQMFKLMHPQKFRSKERKEMVKS